MAGSMISFGKQVKEWEIGLIASIFGEKMNLQGKLKQVYKNRESFDVSDILYRTKYLRVFVAPIVNKEGQLLGAVMRSKTSLNPRHCLGVVMNFSL